MITDLSKAVTRQIKKNNLNTREVVEALQFAHKNRGKTILDGHQATHALKVLVPVFESIFGDLDQLQISDEEDQESLAGLAESSADLATLTQNIWTQVAYEPANMTKALNEVQMTKFRVATHAVELERLKMLEEAIKDELKRRSQTI